MNYQPYQKRVVEEKEELDQRIVLLSGFIGSLTFLKMESVPANLLMQQLTAMKALREILRQRIHIFDLENV